LKQWVSGIATVKNHRLKSVACFDASNRSKWFLASGNFAVLKTFKKSFIKKGLRQKLLKLKAAYLNSFPPSRKKRKI